MSKNASENVFGTNSYTDQQLRNIEKQLKHTTRAGTNQSTFSWFWFWLLLAVALLGPLLLPKEDSSIATEPSNSQEK